MRILLTGGSGFVGSRLLDAFVGEHEVTCIGRTRPAAIKANFLEADITDKSSLAKAAENMSVKDFDAIVHLAAYVPRKHEDDVLEEACAVNIQGTINLLEVFKGRFQKLVIGSSAEVYDQSRITGKLTEDSPVAPGSFYGATKLGSEFIAQSYGKKNNIPVAVLRFSVMYGPADPIARALPNFIKKALNNETIDIKGGDILRDYIHLDDVVESIRDALQSSKAEGVMNIGTGTGVSIQQAAEYIVKAADSKSSIVHHSGGSGVNIVLDINRAKNLIGFEPKVFFPDKLESMIDSYR